MSSCDTKSGCCDEQGSGPAQQDCCPCGNACGGDILTCGTMLWVGSFFNAMKEVQTDILKAKIQKAWGPKMDKAADAVLEAMGTKWQSMMAEANAKADLRSKLHKIWSEAK